MQIPSHPKYDINESGEVRLISTNAIVPEFFSSKNRRTVYIRNKKHRETNQPLDRLLLRTFKPLPDDVDEQWVSVKYIDGNRINISLDNLEWDFTWFEPEGFPGGTHPLGTWFTIPGYEDYEITFTGVYIVRSRKTKQICERFVTDTNYDFVKLKDRRRVGMHKLVAATFIRHPVDYDHLVPNHKNSNTRDNSITNLEWATYTENLNHAYESGGRKHLCKRVLLHDTNTGVTVMHPSVNAVARLLGTNPGMIHGLLTHRQRRGMSYKGFLIKWEDDPTSWSDMLTDTKKNQEPYRIAVKDMYTGEVKIYESLMKIMTGENINAKTVYRLLLANPPIPWNGKCIQAYNEKEELKWPDYPIGVVEAYSKVTKTAKPLKVVDSLGNVEYVSSVTEWCARDPKNRPDRAVVSRAIVAEGRWKDYRFTPINLSEYT